MHPVASYSSDQFIRLSSGLLVNLRLLLKSDQEANIKTQYLIPISSLTFTIHGGKSMDVTRRSAAVGLKVRVK